jgi:hypothetical protein
MVDQAMKFLEAIDKMKAKAKQDRKFAYKLTWGAAASGIMTGCLIEMIIQLIG